MPDQSPVNIPQPTSVLPADPNATVNPPQPELNFPPLPQPATTFQPPMEKKFSLIWIIVGISTLIIGVGVALILGIINGRNQTKAPSEKPSLESTTSPYDIYLSPTPTPLPKTIAPSGTPEFKLKFYRSERATITQAQAVQEQIGATFGNIVISDESIFTQTEVYKGIPIKWTKGQPIPPDRLQWIKEAIDLLPEFFIKDRPVTSFISASDSELGSKSSASLSGAVAYASGLNIFFTNRILKDSVLGAATKKDMVFTLFHEYVHVVQHYEILQTFSEEYLSIPGNLIVVMNILPFNKDFAKTAGWEFQNDDYGDSSYAILGTDVESQKTTDYGKTSYIEDLADTAAGVIACDTAKISAARIKWVEANFIKQPAASFCSARF